MNKKEILFQCEKDLDFLNSHPALNINCYDFMSENLTWTMWQVCKNDEFKDRWGTPETVEVRLYKKDPKFDEFFDKYKDPDDTDEDIADKHYSIDVPYREVYGYEWEFARFKYCADFSFFKFDKKYLDAADNSYYEPKYFNRYQGANVRGKSLEECIVKIGKFVRKNFGDFKYDSFLTPEEKANHEIERAFHFDDEINVVKDDGKSYKGFTMKDNPKYIPVSDAVLNLRWWDWYRQTRHYKKCWKGE